MVREGEYINPAPMPRQAPKVIYRSSSSVTKELETSPTSPNNVPMKAIGLIPTLSLRMLETMLMRNVRPVETDPTNAEKEIKH